MGPGRFGPLRSIADVEAIERVPLADRLEAGTVYGCLKAAAERFPERTAIIDLADPADPSNARRWTYDQLLGEVTRHANALARIGQGAPVGYLLPNLAETHFVLWGGAAGVGSVPINPLLSAEVVAEILGAAGARCVVTPPEGSALYNVAERARSRLGELAILTLGPGGSLEAACREVSETELEFGGAGDLDRVATYFHTGGTTGAPKLAQQTRFNQAAMQWMLRCALDLDEHDVVLTGLPLFHANAGILTGLAPLCAGSTLLLGGPDGFRNKALLSHFWRLVERFQVSVFSGVPTIFASLLDYPVGEADLSSLRYGVVGAAPMPVSVFERFESRTGLKILELYGMTESTCVSTCNPRDGERRVGSIGLRLPYHEVTVGVFDERETFIRFGDPGEVGNLLLRGPSVIPGYKQVARNAGTFIHDRWLNSGDLGRIDEDGYVWLTGRAKDLIIRSGHNIDPGMIEEALSAHDEVELVAAVGQPDPYAGEVPVAYVTLRDASVLSCDELMAFASARIFERPALPKAIRIVPSLPKTAVGKIFKPELREDATRHAVLAALLRVNLEEVEVSVRTDRQTGLVVRISVADQKSAPAIAEALKGFAFTLEFA